MSAFEKISSSLEYIHGKLGMLFEHEPRFKAKPSKRLNNALYKVFKAYWAFFEDVYSLLYSTKHHRPKGLGSHLKDFITGHVAEVESHINGFKELCDMANEEIHLASEQKRDQENAILQEGIERILAEMSTQEKEYLHEECRRFKAWIAPVDMNEKMKTLLKKRTPGTGSWIFRDKSFRSCLDGESSNKVKTRSVLWLTAGPGFGKSSLAAFLADHLRRTVTTGVAYFSVDTTSNETETSIVPALLRTVLDQLFADDPITNEPHFEIKPSTIRNAGHLCVRPEKDQRDTSRGSQQRLSLDPSALPGRGSRSAPGQHLNSAGINGWTPMHCAAQRGLEVLRHTRKAGILNGSQRRGPSRREITASTPFSSSRRIPASRTGLATFPSTLLRITDAKQVSQGCHNVIMSGIGPTARAKHRWP